ncbi:hypothetical protein F4778DRAFT_786212 [Xylariomycetidae sp. FL2044]|nr:hypothetical protein F4778DRAFT_786212 [Xylariomycetidae sp. FL2044]
MQLLPLGAAVLAVFGASVLADPTIAMDYCASINTASTAGNSSIYQSDGLCHDFCIDDYAFAVVKDSECWCSDYAPASEVSVNTNECDTQCPGYPQDVCGGDSLWGYMSLNQAPAGTQGASTSTTTTSTPDPITETVHQTVTFTPTLDPTTTSDDSTETTEATTEATTEKSTKTTTPTPSVSIATVTAGGVTSLQTVTVMPSVADDPDSSATSNANATGMKSSQHGLSTGAAVGVAVGVLGAVVILGAIGAFFWLKRKRQQQEQELADGRTSQRGSSAGMMSSTTTPMQSLWDGENMSTGRRNSRLLPHDPRMDPYATNLYTRFDNKSHESVNTLQDNHDYSRRVLRTTNPDPDGS